jgi:hypothetical protein
MGAAAVATTLGMLTLWMWGHVIRSPYDKNMPGIRPADFPDKRADYSGFTKKRQGNRHPSSTSLYENIVASAAKQSPVYKKPASQ